MAISLRQQRPASPSTAKLHQALLTTLTPLTLTNTHLSLPPQETSLHPILSTALATISKIYSYPTTASLEHFLPAIFPPATLPILLDQTGALLSGLSDHDKASLYIQAIAGLVLLHERLAKHSEISAQILNRELQLFSECEKKTEVLGKIDESGLLSECYTKEGIVEFLVGVIESQQEEKAEKEEGLALERTETEAEAVFTNEKADWEVGGRPYGNMGLPWGFTIMALN